MCPCFQHSPLMPPHTEYKLSLIVLPFKNILRSPTLCDL